ncbi:hypothetical protein [Nocardioides mangrovi]|uniref:Cell division protein FtsL n=1 Tax=Nocardioides mangrovi TaxID=2874580 RepID=A0ABS7U763_9ACTN|nr:hypothetical protein [Nocardioides mangrovi]MBZ5736808.1 hypothetical protein [Nocardioides mangrovi]
MSSPAMQVRSRLPRIASGAIERARLTVVPRRRTKAKRMPFIALVSLVLLGGVVGLLLFNTSMQQASFMASNLEDQATTLAARQQGLQMELDQLRDPQRIAGQAQKLGMVQACTPAFIQLGTGKVTGDPCAGTAADAVRINPLPPTKPADIDPQPNVVVVQPPAGSGQSGQGASNKSNSGDTTGAGNRAQGGRDGKNNQ